MINLNTILFVRRALLLGFLFSFTIAFFGYFGVYDVKAACEPGWVENSDGTCVLSGDGDGGLGGDGDGGLGGDGSGGCGSGSLCNPLESSTIQEFLLKIIDILLIFATPVIVFFIIYAGYLFTTARGDSGQISDAKHALTWAVIGGVIILGARAIIAVVQGTVDAL